MNKASPATLAGAILEEDIALSLEELCSACKADDAQIAQLVDAGILDPVGKAQTEWRFTGVSVMRARSAFRLNNDLQINFAGVALALDLLAEIQKLRNRLIRLE